MHHAQKRPYSFWDMFAGRQTWSPHGRGVVVRERGGTPFRQIFWSRNGAPANIVGHRWNANTEAFRQIKSYSLGWPTISLFSGPNCPQRGIRHQKSPKKISGGVEPLPQPPPARLPRCWALGLGNRSPKSKFTTTPLPRGLAFLQILACSAH